MRRAKINIPPHSGGYFSFGHSPNHTGSAQGRFMLACQPCADYLLPVNGSSLRTPLTLTDSLPCCDLVLSSTTSFLSTSGKKRGKETPQGTNGSLTSLRGRRALGLVRFCHANWPLHLSGAKCGIDFPLTTSVAPADSRALFAPANRGAFAHRCPSRFQRIFAAPKAGDFLEFTSFDLPQAALR